MSSIKNITEISIILIPQIVPKILLLSIFPHKFHHPSSANAVVVCALIVACEILGHDLNKGS